MAGEKGRYLGALAAIAVLVSVLMASAALSAPTNPPRSPTSTSMRTSAAPTGLYFDYMVIILMENQNLCSVYNHAPCGGGTAGVYETNLADNYSIPLEDHYCNTNPSLPNYLCLSGASQFGCSGTDTSPNTGCAMAAWLAPNIVDRLESGGVTWKAYMENMTSNCLGSDAYPYAVRHDPFVYYNDIVSNSGRCNRVVPAGTNDATFLSDLGSTSTASNYMWLTPNVLNDAHDTNVAYADAYLANLVPQILGSPVFTSQRAALFITYDEGYGQPTFALWAGPVVKRGYTSTVSYTHYSVLSTIEANWNLPYLNATNDGAATNMSEFFTPAAPNFSLSANPVGVYFPPGGTAESNISVHATGGFTGTVALSNSSSPSGVNTTCSPSSITPGVLSTCTFSGAPIGNYTVNITGTSGTLTHTVSIKVTVSNSPPPVTTMQPQGTLGASGWYVSTVLVTLTATNLAGGHMYYRLDTGPWQTYSNPFPVGDGSHALEYNATNGAGVSEVPHTATVKVDTAPPFVTTALVGAVGAHGWYTSGVRVTLNAIDNASGVASVSYRVDTGSVKTYLVPFDVTDGIHVVVYFATDVAGLRSTSGSLSLMIDTSPPVFHSLLPSGVVTQSTVTVSWNATDLSGISGFQVRVDNGSYQNVGVSTSMQLNLTDGAHTVQVVATDNAGLNNAAVIQFQVNTGPAAPSAWPLLLPLLATIAVLAAFAIALVVFRMRRRRQGRDRGWP